MPCPHGNACTNKGAHRVPCQNGKKCTFKGCHFNHGHHASNAEAGASPNRRFNPRAPSFKPLDDDEEDDEDDEDDEDNEGHPDTFYPASAACTCCHGKVYGCKGVACKHLGQCECQTADDKVLEIPHEDMLKFQQMFVDMMTKALRAKVQAPPQAPPQARAQAPPQARAQAPPPAPPQSPPPAPPQARAQAPPQVRAQAPPQALPQARAPVPQQVLPPAPPKRNRRGNRGGANRK